MDATCPVYTVSFLRVHVNAPPLAYKPFITAAFIMPGGLVMDRWEGRAALESLPHSTSNLTFHWSLFICHPQAPTSRCITVSPRLRQASAPSPRLRQAKPLHRLRLLLHPITQKASHLLFSLFWGWDRHTFLSASVYLISQDAPGTPPPFPGDEWPLAISLTARQLMPHNYSINV